MAIGSFGPVVFKSSDRYSLVPTSIKRTSGSTWATHDVIGGRQRTEYTGKKLVSVSLDIELNAGLGVRPRDEIEELRSIAEKSRAYRLIIGGRPLASHTMRLTELSDEWGTVYRGGELWSAKVSCTFEEYA